MTGDFARTREELARVFEQRSKQVRISPAWLATEVCRALDGALDMQRLAPELYRLAHAQVKQMARAICRETFEDGGDAAQHEFFPELQKRYPVMRRGKQQPEYVLLEHLTGADVAFNVARLRSEAGAKLKHADALQAWDRARSHQAKAG